MNNKRKREAGRQYRILNEWKHCYLTLLRVTEIQCSILSPFKPSIHFYFETSERAWLQREKEEKTQGRGWCGRNSSYDQTGAL